MMGGVRPLDQVVQIWGTGELELNGSKQASSGTYSVSRRSDNSYTVSSMGNDARMNAIYVHE